MDTQRAECMLLTCKRTFELTRPCGPWVAAGTVGMTVVFDAGQNGEDNLAHMAGAGLHYIGSVPASDGPNSTGRPAS